MFGYRETDCMVWELWDNVIQVKVGLFCLLNISFVLLYILRITFVSFNDDRLVIIIELTAGWCEHRSVILINF